MAEKEIILFESQEIKIMVIVTMLVPGVPY
jgi:hypothetical protein